MPVSTARNSNKSSRRITNKLFLFSLVLSFLFLGLAAPNITYAVSWDWLANALAWPVYGLAWLLGELLSVVIYFLITVAQYNSFIDAEPVKQGWVIVRDLCNMFFVIVLLAIAFGTVLKIETYHYKRLLPKFLLMAILINFSKTIAGLLIDFSQIITLTFVAGFSSIAGGNLITALHIKDYLSFDPNAPDYSKNSLQTFGAAVLALITVTISLIVVVIITIIFVFRIVALWILVILSPLAYLLSIVPTGQRYASQWWQTFTKYIIVGPVLAFFLWLSLTTSVNVQDKIAQMKPAGLGAKPTATITKMGTVENMGGFIIGICLLVGSLIAATQIGAAGGKIAGDWAGRIQQGAVGRYGPTPMRWARERLEAFQARRAAEQKERAAMTGEKMYGTYKTVATVPRAVTRAGWETMRGFIRQKETPKDRLKRAEARREREEKEMHKQELIRAHLSGIYTKGGKEYRYDDSKDRYVASDGEIAKFKDKNKNKEFGALKGWKADLATGWRLGMAKATGIRQVINDERIAKKQKLVADAGLSMPQLIKVLTDSAASRDERLAASLALAVKEGFSDRNQVNVAKEIIAKDPILLKKFDDTLDKQFAHLNYNLATAEGRKKFQERIDEGAFDGINLHHNAYKDKDVIETLNDYYGVGFAAKMETTAGRSKAARGALSEGLLDARDISLAAKPLYDKITGELNPYAKAIARIHGDIIKAFNNSADNTITNFDESSQEAAIKFFETAKPAWLDNFNTGNLKIDEVKKNFKLDESKAYRVIDMVEEAIGKGIDDSKLASMQRAGYSPEFIARSIGIIKNREPEKYNKQIAKNNILVNIKGIEPASSKRTAKETGADEKTT